MERILLVATGFGMVICRREKDAWQPVRTVLQDHDVTSVIAREGVILGGTTEGIFRSNDLGQSWQPASTGLETRHVRWLAYHPDISDFELAGTEPAEIYVSRDGANSWQSRPEVARLREQHGWYLPYSPAAGCVRGFAIHSDRAYAAVEDGCVLVSNDNCQTWRLAEGSSGSPDHSPAPGFVHSDVHSISVHHTSADLVCAPTGGGLYTSADGGKTWRNRYPCYCRAAWVEPGDSRHIIFGPADGVDRNGRIEESHDGGDTWQLKSHGLDVPWRNHMVERLTQVGDELLAVLSNGELLCANLSNLRWQKILGDVAGIAAVDTMIEL